MPTASSGATAASSNACRWRYSPWDPDPPNEEAWQRSRSQLDRALAKRSWLTPAATVIFGGADPPERRQTPRRDLRDWAAIEKWAQQISAIAASHPASTA